ncbi:death-associated protein 1 isoform X2 [Mauremys mutica]|uniref:death-associated protein 1 isoform X2 n=1 Tax=Mauremys mutica TaxID=74926 RepID=UPI001D16DD46|nr:death-associated protein 1 isoform X2 [Mauremys mutica]
MSSPDQERAETRAGHPPAVKAGGMRIVQKHPHTPDAKEEKDKDDQEWESSRNITTTLSEELLYCIVDLPGSWKPRLHSSLPGKLTEKAESSDGSLPGKKVSVGTWSAIPQKLIKPELFLTSSSWYALLFLKTVACI